MFYIIEKVEQLGRIREIENGYVDIVPYNYNFHPKLQEDKISLVYIRSFIEHEKGYIICVKHSESLSLSWETVKEFLLKKIKRIFVLDKKKFLYFLKREEIYDLNFVEILNGNPIVVIPENKTIDYFYRKFPNNPELNCLIPISKHFEQKEALFDTLRKNEYFSLDQEGYFLSPEFKLNNEGVTETFYGIENKGIELDKDNFVNHFKHIEYPEFNIKQGVVYTHYNLYTTTGRPSNHFNEINFAALNKTNGERNSFKAHKTGKLIEFDVNGMHPRIIGGMIDFPFPKDQNVYEYLGVAKEEVFHNIYGGIKKEYQDKPFFKQIYEFTNKLWISYSENHYYKAILRYYYKYDINNPSKLFNYIIQSRETFFNISIITKINNYLKTNEKKSRIILTTYDSYLLNYDESDGVECLEQIKSILPKSKVTVGECYGRMEQYEF